jgi:hypothetical protein
MNELTLPTRYEFPNYDVEISPRERHYGPPYFNEMFFEIKIIPRTHLLVTRQLVLRADSKVLKELIMHDIRSIIKSLEGK